MHSSVTLECIIVAMVGTVTLAVKNETGSRSTTIPILIDSPSGTVLTKVAMATFFAPSEGRADVAAILAAGANTTVTKSVGYNEQLLQFAMEGFKKTRKIMTELHTVDSAVRTQWLGFAKQNVLAMHLALACVASQMYAETARALDTTLVEVLRAQIVAAESTPAV